MKFGAHAIRGLALAICGLCFATLAEERSARNPLAQDVAIGELTAEQAELLAETMADYRRPTAGAQLQTARLREILADMRTHEPSRISLWQRLWQWLKASLTERRLAFSLEWLQALLQVSTSAWLWRLCMAVFIVTAAVVLVHELRQTHWRRRRRVVASGVSASLPAQQPALSWQDIAELPTGQRPGAVLRLVLASLNDGGLAFARAGNTHRDIAQGAHRLDEHRATRLRQLASQAEFTRFGGWQPDADESERLIRLGREILAAKPSTIATGGDTSPDVPAASSKSSSGHAE